MVARLLLLVGALTVAAACSPAAAPQAAPAQGAGATSSAPAAAPTSAPASAALAKPAAKPAAVPPAAPAPAPAPAQESLALASKSAQGAQAADAASGQAPSQGAPDLPIVQGQGRMIIYTTDVTLLVEDTMAFPTTAANVALAHGGYVAGVETREENGIPTVVVRVKVPPQRYEQVMRGLRGLAVEVRAEKAQTQDVSEEYSDVQTQITSLEATHAQLLRLLERSGSVEEILKVQQQANQVKLQIDRLKGRATALERLSDLATITARALSASHAIQRDYTTVRTALRKAEVNRANLESQLRRVRTPEEEAALRDRLAEVLLEIQRLQARIADLEAKAATLRVALPTAENVASQQGRPDEALPREYLDTRIALRRAQLLQAELTRAIRAGTASAADREALSQAVLESTRLSTLLKNIQERAQQAGVVLPALDGELETALVGSTGPESGWAWLAPIRSAWNASLQVLQAIATGVATVVVFLWWFLPLAALLLVVARRRRVPLPVAPTAPSPAP